MKKIDITKEETDKLKVMFFNYQKDMKEMERECKLIWAEIDKREKAEEKK